MPRKARSCRTGLSPRAAKNAAPLARDELHVRVLEPVVARKPARVSEVELLLDRAIHDREGAGSRAVPLEPRREPAPPSPAERVVERRLPRVNLARGLRNRFERPALAHAQLAALEPRLERAPVDVALELRGEHGGHPAVVGALAPAERAERERGRARLGPRLGVREA